ncbi:MAG: hypothetical protein K1000chlam3_01347 [Chlamydiae bacterium]|nr:hypothetical protein [Chlamydiota bacterium]
MRAHLKFKYIIICVFLCLWFCVFQEINTDDETWFLQVVNRVLSGDVLYRDVFLGVTPLSVYIPAFFCWIFGSELLVVRLVHALYFAVGIFLSCGILKELKGSHSFSFLFILSFFVFAHSQVTWGYSGYNALANVFFLGCFYFTLRWINYFSIRQLALAAAMAGLCFCTKQNVGALAFICLLTVFIVVSRHARIKSMLVLFFSFSIVIAACLISSAIQGGWGNFLDYVIFNKSRYLRSGHPNYFLIPSSWDSYSIFIFIAPFSLVFLLIFSFIKRKVESIILWIFLFAAILTLYPRPDNAQKMLCIPFVLIAIVYFFDSSKFKKGILGTWFSLALIFSLSQSSMGFFQGKKRISKIPHFRGIVMDKKCHMHWKSMKKRFTRLDMGDRLFFLSTHAGFYYLLFDLKNPTPFDLPIHPALGCHGEELIQQKIQIGQIDKIFIDHISWTNWLTVKHKRPFQLEAFMHQNMEESEGFIEDFFDPIFQMFQNPRNP